MSESHARVLEAIDAATPEDGGYTAAEIAEKVVANLPAPILDEWLHEHAAIFLTDLIGQRDRSRRASARHGARARTFSSLASDAQALADHFSVVFVVNEQQTRKLAGDMTGADHTYVADEYGHSGRYDLLMEQFHRAVAKRVGRKTTREVFTPETYDRLFTKFVGEEPA